MGAALVLLASLWLPWFTDQLRQSRTRGCRAACRWRQRERLAGLLDARPAAGVRGAAPFILTWIIARGHALTWKPGEVTMIVGIVAFMLILCNGIILGRPGDSVDIGLGIGYFVGLLGVARSCSRPAICARPCTTTARKPPGVDYSVRPHGIRGAEARSQPRAGARARHRGRGARVRPLDRPRRQGGRRRRGRRRDAAAARHGADGRHRRDRRGREGRGADALQRRADRRRHRRPRSTSPSTRWRAPTLSREGHARTRSR